MLGQLTDAQIVQAASAKYESVIASGGSAADALNAIAAAGAVYGISKDQIVSAFVSTGNAAVLEQAYQQATGYAVTLPEPITTRPSTAEIVNAANYTFWGAGAGADGLNAVVALAQVNGLTFDDVIDAYRQTGGTTWTEFAVIVQRLTGRNLGVPMPIPPAPTPAPPPPPTVTPPIQPVPRQPTAQAIVNSAILIYNTNGGGAAGYDAILRATYAAGLGEADIRQAFLAVGQGDVFDTARARALAEVQARGAPPPAPAPAVSTRPSAAEIVNSAILIYNTNGGGAAGYSAVLRATYAAGLGEADIRQAFLATGQGDVFDAARARALAEIQPRGAPQPTVSPPIQQVPRSPVTDVPVVRSRRITLTAPQIVTAINRAYELGGGGDPGVTAAMLAAERAGIPWQEVVNAFRTADGGAGWAAFSAIITRYTGTAPVATVAAPPLVAAAPGMPGWLIPAALAALSFMR